MRRTSSFRLLVLQGALVARAWASVDAAPRTLGRRVGPLEHEVRKSVFISYAAPASSVAEARAVAEEMRTAHARAGHVCYACVCDDGTRAVDDGEPSGTAGVPILQALQTQGLVRSTLVVARFRRGPKLGAGGLIRAYGAAARQVLAAARDEGVLEPVSLMLEMTVALPVADVGALYSAARAVGSARCTVVSEDFAGSMVHAVVAVAVGEEESFLERVVSLSQGRAARLQ